MSLNLLKSLLLKPSLFLSLFKVSFFFVWTKRASTCRERGRRTLWRRRRTRTRFDVLLSLPEKRTMDRNHQEALETKTICSVDVPEDDDNSQRRSDLEDGIGVSSWWRRRWGCEQRRGLRRLLAERPGQPGHPRENQQLLRTATKEQRRGR